MGLGAAPLMVLQRGGLGGEVRQQVGLVRAERGAALLEFSFAHSVIHKRPCLYVSLYVTSFASCVVRCVASCVYRFSPVRFFS